MTFFYIILCFSFFAVAVGCKKKQSETKFIGTYAGQWQYIEKGYNFTDTSATPFTTEEWVDAEFNVYRDGKWAFINSDYLKVALKDLEYGKRFFDYGENNGWTNPDPVYWEFTFYEDSVHWVDGRLQAEDYGPEHANHFYGTRQ